MVTATTNETAAAAEALLAIIEDEAKKDRAEGNDGCMAYPIDARLSQTKPHLHGTGRGYRMAIEVWFTAPAPADKVTVESFNGTLSYQLYSDDVDGYVRLERCDALSIIAGSEITLPRLLEQHARYQDLADAVMSKFWKRNDIRVDI